jgi:hypothetical protein
MEDGQFPKSDPIGEAQARFDALTNYEMTLRSVSSAGVSVEARYRYLKPGFIRMDFVRPHAGAVLAYDPKAGDVTLWPFGLHRFPRLALAPDNPLIQGPNAHRIDRSDIGTLLGNVRELERHGEAQLVGKEVIGSRDTAYLTVTGAQGYDVAGVGHYQIWLDLTIGLPIKVISTDAQGELIETVLMDDLRVDVPDIDVLL